MLAIKSIYKTEISIYIKGTLSIFSTLLSAIFLYILLHIFQNMTFVAGFTGLAPKYESNLQFKTTVGTLIIHETLDYNTGARGGAFIDRNFYLLSDKHKNIIVKNSGYVHKPYLSPKYILEIIDDDNSTIITEMRLPFQKIDLYINPTIFTLQEFKVISNTIHRELPAIEKELNKARSKNDIEKPIKIRTIRYQDYDTLRKTFVCTDKNRVIIIPEGGRVTLYSSSQSFDLGYLRKNGMELYLFQSSDCQIDSPNKKIICQNIILENCIENEKNLFDLFTIYKQENKSRL